ncbi:unannotated protein [freshwater metagenome]|uniref:Unannotated protein n=1 Tax=freshwater metagenome TaxID=449393 RepID=A0A6J7D5C7_9ZZZZ|nr:DUF4389 domain-containing protein [Actinomycetota bacterium]
MSKQIKTVIAVDLLNRNKATVFWRGILVVPAAIFLASFSQMSGMGWGSTGILVLPAALSLLFRGIYPSYVLGFNKAFIELETRVVAYLLLLNDEYPSIEANSKVSVTFPEVNGGAALNRGLPLVKWFLAIPLYIVGIIYSLAALAVSVVAWVVTFTSGAYPKWAAEPVLGTIQYWNRVYGYAILLVTDEYPSFKI